MKPVFWGFFFLFLNLILSSTARCLNVLPPFVGCWLLYRGFGEMAAESDKFDSLRPFALGLGIYTALIWVGDLLGMGSESWISSLMGLGCHHSGAVYCLGIDPVPPGSGGAAAG